MMTYMDPHFMGQFSKLVYKSASELTKVRETEREREGLE